MESMIVMKFGGTSMGSAESMKQVADIIASQPGKKIVVVSAMSGITNHLDEINQLLKKGDHSSIEQLLQDMTARHLDLIEKLIPEQDSRNECLAVLNLQFENLRTVISSDYSEEQEAIILTTGELLSSSILSHYMEKEGLNNTFLDAKDFMHVPNLENPKLEQIEELLINVLNREVPSEIYVTQGFVRLDRNRNISTLKRGGSDFSATIIGAAIQAKEVQIWTDIDGFHNNDPRFVEKTHPLSYLTFEEAAELAYFGAKVLHPQTVAPVKEKNIPIFLKNTFTPGSPGTMIFSEVRTSGLKAISAKDGITAIKIKSNRMLMAHGFLKRIFDVFDKHETAIDMITTSEIAVSLTIDDPRNLKKILSEIEEFGEISVDSAHSIICIVGEGVIKDKATYRLFEILAEVPVRMISYGGSNNNISLLVSTQYKEKVLQLLNEKLFMKVA